MTKVYEQFRKNGFLVGYGKDLDSRKFTVCICRDDSTWYKFFAYATLASAKKQFESWKNFVIGD